MLKMAHPLLQSTIHLYRFSQDQIQELKGWGSAPSYETTPTLYLKLLKQDYYIAVLCILQLMQILNNINTGSLILIAN